MNIITYQEFNIDGIGALWGLIGKSGSIPARSRHCNEEQTQLILCHWNNYVLGRYGKAMIQSQENCLYSNHRLTCERWGGDLRARFAFFSSWLCIHSQALLILVLYLRLSSRPMLRAFYFEKGVMKYVMIRELSHEYKKESRGT